MKSVGVVFLLSVVLVFAAGCGDEQVTPVAQSRDGGPALAPPASSGPIVIRGETTFAVFFADQKRGMSVVLGADMSEFCEGIIDFDIVNFMDIDIPNDADRIVEILNGTDVTTSVWPFTVFDCELFTTVTPVAVGTSDVVSTDNDLLAFLEPATPNHNAYGWQAHGVLTSPDGVEWQFSGINRLNWDGVDLDTLKEVAKVLLAGPGK